ncbi:MAG: hypothetical protein ACE5J5_01410 [Candidatus Hydrothermarchaeales archaeon]
MKKKILVSLRYPITKRGRNTLHKAMEIVEGDNVSVSFYHVNLIYNDKRITRRDFKREVEKNEERLKTMRGVRYSVEESYLLDESILKKISETNIDTLIIGKTMESRWKKFLKFWGDYNLSDEIKKAADCKVIVVE